MGVRVNERNWKTDGEVLLRYADGRPKLVVLPKSYVKKHPKFVEDCFYCMQEHGGVCNVLYITSVRSDQNEYWCPTCQGGFS